MTKRATSYGLCLAALVCGSAPARAQPEAPAAPPTADDDLRARAKERFDAGLAQLEKRSFELALGEFARSLEILPTRAATENAAVCLKALDRADEALPLFEKVLSFPDVPEEVRARVEPQIAELRARTGTLLVQGAEKGAVLSIDGRPRGTLPLDAPLRVSVGLRTVRIHLEGYVPFVQTVEIVADKPVELSPKLEVLARAGRLRVSEAGGGEVSVSIDGVIVGTTPWEGALAPGDDAIWVRGAGGDGTAPTKATVLLGQRSEILLKAVPLDAELAVAVTPAEATIAIDDVVVGTSKWSGRLPSGRVRVSVSAPGYVSASRLVTLRPDSAPSLRIGLEPVVQRADAEPPRVPRVELGGIGSFAIAPVFSAASCDAPCASTVALGMHLEGSAAYRFASGFGLGGAVGYLRITQTLEDRAIPIAPPGKDVQEGSASDELVLSGATFLAQASMRFGRRFFGSIDAGAGGFVAAVRDEKSYASRASDGASYRAGPYRVSGIAGGLAAMARVRGGVEIVDGFEAWVGATPLLLVPLARPDYAYADPVSAGADGAAILPTEPILRDLVVAVSPSIGLGAFFE